MAFQLANRLPPGMPGDFQYCPHCCVAGGSCGSGDTRGTDVWQEWYDASGLAMPVLTPGSDMKISQLMNADHGGQVWVMAACGNEINEDLNWTFFERSDFDRDSNFMPSSPEIYGWIEDMNFVEYREWWVHVPSWFTCASGTAVGRWLWKTGNSCNDYNNAGMKTTSFSADECAAANMCKSVGACGASPETFISCIDWKIAGSSSPSPVPSPPQCTDDNQYCSDWAANGECERNPAFMLVNCRASCGACPQPTPAPTTPAPPPPTPSSCADNNQYCSDWAANGECETNPGYMLTNCRASCGVCSGPQPSPATQAPTPAPTQGPPQDPREGCFWTTPPGGTVTLGKQSEKPGRICWTVDVPTGYAVHWQSSNSNGIYHSWNGDKCCQFSGLSSNQSNVVTFTPQYGNFGFCECINWSPQTGSLDCAGQATAEAMICPIEGSSDMKDMCTDSTSPNTCGGAGPAPTPPTQPTPTSAPTPTQGPPPSPPPGPGQCCYPCGGNCQDGWCSESQANCEGTCYGEWCTAAVSSSILRKVSEHQ